MLQGNGWLKIRYIKGDNGEMLVTLEYDAFAELMRRLREAEQLSPVDRGQLKLDLNFPEAGEQGDLW